MGQRMHTMLPKKQKKGKGPKQEAGADNTNKDTTYEENACNTQAKSNLKASRARVHTNSVTKTNTMPIIEEIPSYPPCTQWCLIKAEEKGIETNTQCKELGKTFVSQASSRSSRII
jgi:hypothetical protein